MVYFCFEIKANLVASHLNVKLNVVIIVIFQYINNKATYETDSESLLFYM